MVVRGRHSILSPHTGANALLVKWESSHIQRVQGDGPSRLNRARYGVRNLRRGSVRLCLKARPKLGRGIKPAWLSRATHAS